MPDISKYEVISLGDNDLERTIEELRIGEIQSRGLDSGSATSFRLPEISRDLRRREVELLYDQAINESNRRNTLKISKNGLELSKSGVAVAQNSKEISKLTLCFSIIATLLALGAFIFSAIDYLGDKQWQSEQITALEQVISNTKGK